MADDCAICHRTVKDDQEALCCDGCDKWSHRECLGLSKTTYKKLEKSTEAWKCDVCKKKKEADSKTINKSKDSYTNYDIMSKLLEMDDKYNKLFEKYEKQLKENQDLRKEIHAIKKQLNAKEQQDLNNNIIIQGIPYKENEKIETVAQKLASLLEVPNNIEGALRLGERKQDKVTPIKIIF